MVRWGLDPSCCVHWCPGIPSLLCTTYFWSRTAERSQPKTEALQSKTSTVLRSLFQLFQITAACLSNDTNHREHTSLRSFSSLVPHWQVGRMQVFTLPFKSPKQDWLKLLSILHTAWLSHHLPSAERMDLSTSSKYCDAGNKSFPKSNPWPWSSLLERQKWRGTTIPGQKTVSLSLALSHSCNRGSRREAAAQATNKQYTAEWRAVC